MQTTQTIQIIGASANNLKNINADIPIGSITAICGPSGCGKSSLVLDVLHAESRRRYLETLGSSAALMLGGPKHVPVKTILNLRPSIALECGDKTIARKATVSSLAEIAPALRILYAESAKPACPKCGSQMESLTPQQITEKLSQTKEGTKIQILAPINPNGKTLRELAQTYLAQGHIKAIADNGEPISLDYLSSQMENQKPTQLNLIIDRIIAKENQRTRLSEAIDAALKTSSNLIIADIEGQKHKLSTIPRCPNCSIAAPPLTERSYSPWSIAGQCPACKGDGQNENGQPCPACNGNQLKPQTLQSKWQTYSWQTLHNQTIQQLQTQLPPLLQKAPKRLQTTLNDIPPKLQTLAQLGLGHLTLGRLASTLSSGEAQRARLAALCAGHLNGVLLCIDEPASGLHPRDIEKLWSALQQLKTRGNTLALIEHHPAIINRADCIIELGPGAGENGGQIMPALHAGADPCAFPPNIKKNKTAIIEKEKKDNPPNILIKNITANNLKNLTIKIPSRALTLISGISGSGKSTLLWKSIEPLAAYALGQSKEPPPAGSGTLQQLQEIEAILPARSGRAFAQKRSTIATSTEIMQNLKNLYASLPESKARGYQPPKFGTDKPGGRCETCKGDGYLLDPSGYEESECPICQGKRYKDETLEIRYKLMSISDTLNLTVSKALETFASFEHISSKLKPLADTGLSYLRLGQPTTHLSGGELQRLRLAQDLAKAKLPKTLYLLDEPARGLSPKDALLLLDLLDGLTQKGHTVIAIEHNELFRERASCILELGPEAGEAGGYLI